MSAHVCKIFDNLYKQLPDEDNKEKQIVVDNLLYEAFCPTNENSYGKCISDCDRISAGFGYLLVQLFENVESENEHEDQEDKYVYYGLMWASYKLQQLNKNRDKPISLNEFFTNNIVKGQWYEIIKEHIEPKKSLLNNDINIEYMSDIYYIFKETCKIFSNDSSDLDHLEDFSSYYQSIISCGEKLKKRSNNGDTDTNDSSCNTLYDMLNHVYDDFRKDYFKNKPTNDSLPDLPDFKKIKEPSKPDLGISDSQDSIDKKPETQDGDSQNSDSVTNNEHINSTNNLEQQQNEEPTEGTISNIVLDGSTVPEYEFTITSYKPHDFIDGVEVPDIEAEYFDAQDEFLYIDTDLSHSVIEPKYMYFSHPDLDIEQNNLDIEQNDLDNEQTDFYNQPQPHQINTLKFDDPFKHPENFSDSIMCKLHGPKSVYCNRIICNRIKIGVIALSIPIALVFAYKVNNKTIIIYILLNIFATAYIQMQQKIIYIYYFYISIFHGRGKKNQRKQKK
ncbi:CIR protein [Plasmodium chabaudi adami]|uniref:CIR protein n=1 Tax=Plasmodium chabaudi adami TaxID=5826 RepID=A0A1C6WKW5_PLACE|nr:CIR protein [Plasmodium chabaudi adami]